MSLTKLQEMKLRALPGFDTVRRKPFKSPVEWVQTAENLAKERGSIPGSTWMLNRKNGFSALYSYMIKNPKLFQHLPWTRHPTAEERVVEAKRLLRRHGKLPGAAWLIANGHNGLYVYMKRNPKIFQKFPRDRRTRWTSALA